MAQSGYLGTPRVQYFDDDNLFLVGGLVYSYVGGTSTPNSTYPTIEDALAGTNANTWPLVLDSRGEGSIVLSGDTKLVLKRPDGTTVWTQDHLGSTGVDIFDANGNELLKFSYVTSAVNEITITNAATGGGVSIAASGNDTDIDLNLGTKGSGGVTVQTGKILKFNNTANTHYVGLKANTSQATDVTFTLPQADATVANQVMVSDAAGALSFATVNSLLPAGMIAPFGYSTAPTGWLLCDGSAVSRTDYSRLYDAIGAAWGAGDGSTTFNLPNFQRRTLVGMGGTGTATLGNTIASTGGTETHTLAIGEIPSHTHSQTNTNSLTLNAGTGAAGTYPGVAAGSTGSAGGGGSHNNMQPSAVVNWCIKT